MKHFTSTIIALLFLTPTSFSVEIPEKCRVDNTDQGVCVWASLETVSRYHKIEAMNGITDKMNRATRNGEHPIGATFYELANVLEEYGVRNYYFKSAATGKGIRAYKHLKLFCKTTGVVVGLDDYRTSKCEKSFKSCWIYEPEAGYGSRHAVVLASIDDEYCIFHDPNNHTAPFIVTREWFDYYWTGEAVAFLSDNQEPYRYEQAKATKCQSINELVLILVMLATMSLLVFGCLADILYRDYRYRRD